MRLPRVSYPIRKAVIAAVFACALAACALLAAPQAFAVDSLTTSPQQQPAGPQSVYATSTSGNFKPNFDKMANLPYAVGTGFPSTQAVAFDTYTGKDGYRFGLTDNRNSIAVTHFTQNGSKIASVKTVKFTNRVQGGSLSIKKTVTGAQTAELFPFSLTLPQPGHGHSSSSFFK